MKYQLLLLITLWMGITLKGQDAPFQVIIEPMDIPELGGVHSFAVGQADGKWLIVGGRLDGLHRRQPFAAFAATGNNNQLIVVDPVTMQKWTAPLTTLPVSIQEQLSSTNMQFYQEGNFLYFVGGYGYSATENDHFTYDKLTAIDVPVVMDAIINNADFTAAFRQITDTEFQVTGGNLKKMNGNYYLMGGQKFIGRYNPMGPNNGSGFIQEYTDGVRVFSLTDDGVNITIEHLPSFVDAAKFHRRDYNAEAQILPDGSQGLTMFSGVFQPAVDLPFLDCVDINADGYNVVPAFTQYYNHYHCGVAPLYSASNNEMHNVFFGGIAQFYDLDGTLTQDNNVPFVKTIARVTRNAEGMMTEYKLPVEMPSLLGAGSEFIPLEGLPEYDNKVLKLDEILTADTTLIGYIYGGINSTEANIFWINDGNQSSASSQIFKVYITNSPVGIHEINEQSNSTLNVVVYPNPNYGDFAVDFFLEKNDNVKITLMDVQGKIIKEIQLENLSAGPNTYSKTIAKMAKQGVYFLILESSYDKVMQRVVVDW